MCYLGRVQTRALMRTENRLAGASVLASRSVLAGAFVLASAVLAGALSAGCRRGAGTPEEAYARFAEAVKTRDGKRLYDALDLETRWSWMTVRRAHREAYDIVLSNFPEGAEREQRSRRYEAAAQSDSEAALFAEQLTPARWEELAVALRGLPEPPVLQAGGADEVTIAATAGPPLRFRKGQDGRWGYASLAAEAEDRKRRASADLELTRSSAADFERAAARAGK
jgi:hypothetical protein